jgi:hypothetical protein
VLAAELERAEAELWTQELARVEAITAVGDDERGWGEALYRLAGTACAIGGNHHDGAMDVSLDLYLQGDCTVLVLLRSQESVSHSTELPVFDCEPFLMTGACVQEEASLRPGRSAELKARQADAAKTLEGQEDGPVGGREKRASGPGGYMYTGAGAANEVLR